MVLAFLSFCFGSYKRASFWYWLFFLFVLVPIREHPFGTGFYLFIFFIFFFLVPVRERPDGTGFSFFFFFFWFL